MTGGFRDRVEIECERWRPAHPMWFELSPSSPVGPRSFWLFRSSFAPFSPPLPFPFPFPSLPVSLSLSSSPAPLSLPCSGYLTFALRTCKGASLCTCTSSSLSPNLHSIFGTTSVPNWPPPFGRSQQTLFFRHFFLPLYFNNTIFLRLCIQPSVLGLDLALSSADLLPPRHSFHGLPILLHQHAICPLLPLITTSSINR